MSSVTAKMKMLLILAALEKQKLNFSRSTLFQVKIRVTLRYFVNDCLRKHFLASNSPQTPSNLISLTILVTRRLFKQSQVKIRAINL